MKMFCIFIEAFFNFVYWGEEKMMQNGQTEPEGVIRSCMCDTASDEVCS